MSVVGLLLVAWLVGTAVASAPYPALASQVRRSVVIAAVDARRPDRGPQLLRRASGGSSTSSGFPDVFGGLAPTRAAEVAPPDPALAASAVVTAVRAAVLKITGVADVLLAPDRGHRLRRTPPSAS